jgi:molybdate transport repressor ModE-like protein
VHRGDRLRLRHLRLLDLVRRRGSLGAAARALGVSQPAATLLLRELEAAFGTVLVERDRRGARVTASGLRALERLTVTLASFEHAIEAARLPAVEPVLRVGAVQMAGMHALPGALAALERAGYAGRIQLREGRARDLLGALREGTLDCVIGWMDESLADAAPVELLRVEPLWYSRMLVIAAAKHPLAKARSVDVAELARWRWIVPPPGSRTHAAFLRLFLHNGVAAPPVAVECAALHTTLHIVAATRSLAVAPDTVVGHYARQRLVTALRGRALDLGRNQVSLVTRRDSESMQAVTRFREALAAAAD